MGVNNGFMLYFFDYFMRHGRKSVSTNEFWDVVGEEWFFNWYLILSQVQVQQVFKWMSDDYLGIK